MNVTDLSWQNWVLCDSTGQELRAAGQTPNNGNLAHQAADPQHPLGPE